MRLKELFLDIINKAKETNDDSLKNIILELLIEAEIGLQDIQAAIDNLRANTTEEEEKEEEPNEIETPDQNTLGLMVYPQPNGGHNCFLNLNKKTVGFYVNKKGELVIQGHNSTKKYKTPTLDTLKEILNTLEI